MSANDDLMSRESGEYMEGASQETGEIRARFSAS